MATNGNTISYANGRPYTVQDVISALAKVLSGMRNIPEAFTEVEKLALADAASYGLDGKAKEFAMPVTSKTFCEDADGFIWA